MCKNVREAGVKAHIEAGYKKTKSETKKLAD
jgi:hypothetical protein